MIVNRINGSGSNGPNEQACGNCHHWHKQPLQPGQVPMVGQPAQGQCREGPPSVTSIPAPQGLMQVTDYPKPAENCPACSRFKARLAVVET